MRKLGVLLVGMALAAFGTAAGCSSGSKTTTGGNGGSGNNNNGGGGNNNGGGGNNNGGGGVNNGGGGNATGGGGGMGVDCTGSSLPAACDSCAQDQCCKELSDCLADPDCSSCLDTGDQASCTAAGTIITDLDDCLQALCATDCKPANACNPITNEGCNGAAGEACDLSNGGNFVCFGPPNDTACNGACDNGAGPFCLPGYTCSVTGSSCVRYCCNDADCGGTAGSCQVDAASGWGACLDMSMMPVCEMPAPDVSMAPSMGSCVTVG